MYVVGDLIEWIPLNKHKYIGHETVCFFIHSIICKIHTMQASTPYEKEKNELEKQNIMK